MSRVTVGDIERSVARAFPPEWAEEWDRTGLLAGDPEREVTGVMLALDPTKQAISAAADRGCNVLATHHPAFLKAPEWLTPGRGAAGVVFSAMDAGVALINAHTNLDRAPAAGLLLAAALGLEPLKAIERSGMPMTLVTVFVPAPSADAVVKAMTGAGAGRVGEYERCSFVSPEGRASFTPPAHGQPFVGEPGTPSSASEVRVEMVAPRNRARGVMAAARAAHPYEEPLVVAADVEIARSSARMGMLCAAPDDLTLRGLAVLAQEAFHMTPVVWGDPETVLSRVATATGSAGSLIGDVMASGAQALVAGEVRYHDALDAADNGLAILELSHDVSEWPLVGLLADAIRLTPGLDPGDVHVLPAVAGWWTP
ncbi:MAG: Nif3-like dinuclear metal center hexameric protein [Coriobacteriia bacterium]